VARNGGAPQSADALEGNYSTGISALKPELPPGNTCCAPFPAQPGLGSSGKILSPSAKNWERVPSGSAASAGRRLWVRVTCVYSEKHLVFRQKITSAFFFGPLGCRLEQKLRNDLGRLYMTDFIDRDQIVTTSAARRSPQLQLMFGLEQFVGRLGGRCRCWRAIAG